MRSKLTYANVMATIAVFIALGGASYAAFHLPKDSVKSRNIVNGQVRARDLANGSVKSAKLKIPTGFKAVGLPPAPSNCTATASWYDGGSPAPNVGYFRDLQGFVHLQGTPVECGNAGVVFFLPPGYRPGVALTEPVAYLYNDSVQDLRIGTEGGVDPDFGIVDNTGFSMDSVTFRCAPSGQDGCP